MKRIAEASAVMSEAVKLCEPQVIPLYPITPQIDIVESLSEHVNNGDLKAKIVRTESEHSMVSTLIGSLATGSRSFSATSSQGLALAHEVLHIISVSTQWQLPSYGCLGYRLNWQFYGLGNYLTFWQYWQYSPSQNGLVEIFGQVS